MRSLYVRWLIVLFVLLAAACGAADEAADVPPPAGVTVTPINSANPAGNPVTPSLDDNVSPTPVPATVTADDARAGEQAIFISDYVEDGDILVISIDYDAELTGELSAADFTLVGSDGTPVTPVDFRDETGTIPEADSAFRDGLLTVPMPPGGCPCVLQVLGLELDVMS